MQQTAAWLRWEPGAIDRDELAGTERTDVIDENKMSKENNFNVIRLGACLLVFVGHMAIIMGIPAPTFGGSPLHELGVSVMFLIGGFLVANSWLHDPAPARYAVRRFFRFWVPFAAMVLLMTFVAGPLVSDLGVSGYYQSPYLSYLKNLRFHIVFSQPGLFTGLPVAGTTNGSIWTMPVEAVMYVLTPAIATAFGVKRRSALSFRAMSAFTGALFLLDAYLRTFLIGTKVVFYTTDLIAAHHLVLMYVMGILFTFPQMKRLLSLQRGTALMGAFLLLSLAAEPLHTAALDLLVPYFVFSFALTPAPRFSGWFKKIDLSYGIFLYGFFFQQLVMQTLLRRGAECGFMQTLVLSAVPTVLAAAVSFYLVEKPMQHFAGFLLRKYRNPHTRQEG